MKKVITILFALVLICGMAFAQGGSEEKAAAAAPDHIDVLHVGLINWPKSFEPSNSIGKTTTRWISNMFDTLLFTENDGSISSYICDSWTRVDDSTFEFKLKKGITFHNGDPLTAKDVKYSFERVLNKTTGSNPTNVRAVIDPVKEIQIIDDYTLRMITRYPDPIFFNRCGSYLSCYIVPMDYIEKNGNEYFGTHPIGTGPYALESSSPETMVFKYYEGYYGKKPIADKIEFRYIVEPVAMATAILNGEIDICPDLTVESAKIIKARSSNEVSVFMEETSLSHLLQFNLKDPVVSNTKLRQAMSLAIDRKLLCDSLWEGYASVPNGYNYPEYGEYYIPDYPEYEYNVEKAKQLVKESGYNGEPVVYSLRPGYYAMGNEAAEAIVAMWQAVGINASVKYDATFTSSKFTETCGVGVTNWSNGLRFSDPLGGLWLLWGEGHVWQKAPAADAFKDEYNRLGHLVEVEQDVEKRKEAYRQLMQVWDNNVIGTIIYCPQYVWSVSNKFKWDFVAGKAISYRAEALSLAK